MPLHEARGVELVIGGLAGHFVFLSGQPADEGLAVLATERAESDKKVCAGGEVIGMIVWHG